MVEKWPRTREQHADTTSCYLDASGDFNQPHLPGTSVTFAKRVGARRTLLFHHDPLHTDGLLDDLHVEARRTWEQLGGDPAQIEMAREREELIVGPSRGAVGEPAGSPPTAAEAAQG